MDDILYLSELYDYYKNLLTDKQCEYFEDYFFENLTMEEIAENNEVSKNAVSKTIIEVKDKLKEYEESLNLLSNKHKIESLLSKEDFDKIKDFV